MASERAAFRSLLRICRQADRQPASLIASLGLPPRFYQGNAGVVSEPAQLWPFVKDTMSEIRGGCTEYAQPVGVAVKAARRHWRLAQALGLNYSEEAAELSRQLQVAQETGIDVLKIARESQKDDASTVIATPTLERFSTRDAEPVQAGDLLLAHPISCIFEQVFDRSVILIDQVEEGGVSGIVLTNPLGTTFRQIMVSVPLFDNSEDDKLGPLLDMPLSWGGPVIHPSEGGICWFFTGDDAIPGSREILPSIWTSGDVDVVSTMAVMDRSRVRFFLGHAGWDSSQLTNELERGVWVHVRPAVASEISELLFNTSEPLAVWRALMQAADMQHLATFPRGNAVDEKLKELVSEHYEEVSTGRSAKV